MVHELVDGQHVDCVAKIVKNFQYIPFSGRPSGRKEQERKEERSLHAVSESRNSDWNMKRKKIYSLIRLDSTTLIRREAAAGKSSFSC